LRGLLWKDPPSKIWQLQQTTGSQRARSAKNPAPTNKGAPSESLQPQVRCSTRPAPHEAKIYTNPPLRWNQLLPPQMPAKQAKTDLGRVDAAAAEVLLLGAGAEGTT